MARQLNTSSRTAEQPDSGVTAALLEDQEEAEGVESTYHPILSVWTGADNELIEKMLSFYPKRPPETILDATVNTGRFWSGSERQVTGVDIDRRYRPTVVADNTRMPFSDESFEIIVYDPPHIPNQGSDKQKDFTLRFGLGAKSGRENGYTFSHSYPRFVKEAYRVLEADGLLLCKITDYIHNHRYQWAHVEFLDAARAVGFVPCDCIIKVRKAPIIDPKWQKAHHARRNHSYWLVFRKSPRCE